VHHQRHGAARKDSAVADQAVFTCPLKTAAYPPKYMSEQRLTELEIPICGQSLLFRLDLTSKTQKLIYDEYKEGIIYEPATVLALSKFLAPGDVFIDLGAHVGFHSVVAAAMVGPSGVVLAFEPNPASYASLSNHIEINKLSHLRAFNMAVGGFDGKATLYENLDNDGECALWPVNQSVDNIKTASTSLNSTSVPQVTLDTIASQLRLSRIDVLKMDVEGSEVKVMEGAQQYLAGGAAKLIIAEFHPFALAQMGNTASQFLKIFYDFGYRGFWSKDGDTFNEITFHPGSFEPYGEWFEFHRQYLFNLFFMSTRHAGV
jgi:FkbM family methyltransferase